MSSERNLGDCPAMIFIPYSVPGDAEARGYSDWLRRIDNPFFNSIPGVLHYANWRIPAGQDTGLAWDYFDFMGLADRDCLQDVWFNPDLDGFRKEWLRLWGYGDPAAERPAHLRYSFLFRLVKGEGLDPGEAAFIRAGRGEPPADDEIVYLLEGYLPKHFAKDAEARGDAPWLLSEPAEDALGFSWIGVSRVQHDGGLAKLSFHAELIAAPNAAQPAVEMGEGIG